jgi:hypothetical protein
MPSHVPRLRRRAIACALERGRAPPVGQPSGCHAQPSQGRFWEFKIPFSFSRLFQIHANFQNSYQIQYSSKIHETSLIILLNSRSIQEKYKTQIVGLELNDLN